MCDWFRPRTSRLQWPLRCFCTLFFLLSCSSAFHRYTCVHECVSMFMCVWGQLMIPEFTQTLVKQCYCSPQILKPRYCYRAVDKLYRCVICNGELLLQETTGNTRKRNKKGPATVWMAKLNFRPLHTNRCLVLRKNDQLNVCSSFTGMCCYERTHLITFPKPCLYSEKFVKKIYIHVCIL